MANTVYSQSVSFLGANVSLNYINAQGSQGSLLQLNTLIQAIDNTFGVLFTTPPDISSSNVTVYDGSTNFCLDVQYPAGSLNTVLQYVGTKLCSLYTATNGAGSLLGADPLSTHGLPVNSPGYVYPTLPTIPTLLPVATYLYPPVSGILNYNPSDVTLAGHLAGIIGALNFADSYAKIRPDYEYLRSTIGGIAPNFVSASPSFGTVLLSLNLGNANYYISGRRIAVSAIAVSLVAFSDNYIDVSINGAYVNNAVANGNPAPAIAADTQRLLKVVTNGTVATLTTSLMVTAPYGNSFLQNQAVDARVIKDKNVGPTQLTDTAVTPGTYSAPTLTIDQQGRITNVGAGSFNIVTPTNKDILQYNSGTSKFVNVPVVGSVLPTGNDGDFLRFNSILNQWESATSSTPLVARYTIPYTGFQPSASAIQTIFMANYGEGFVPVWIKVKHSQSFTGGAIAAASVRIKDDNGFYYTPLLNVFVSSNETVGQFISANFPSYIPNQTIDTNLNLELTLTGGVVNDLLTGSIDIWVSFIQLKL